MEYQLLQPILPISENQTLARGELVLFKRTFALFIAAIILATSFAFQSVQAQGQGTNAATNARIKVDLLSSNARVDVKLLDGTKLKGYLGAKDQDGFTVTDSKTGANSIVRYAEVAEVKKAGGGGSTKTWLIIGAAVAAAAVTWIIVKPVLCDGGAQDRGPC